MSEEPNQDNSPPFNTIFLCKLVGADAADDTITLQLPPGMRPYGVVIGEYVVVSRIKSKK